MVKIYAKSGLKKLQQNEVLFEDGDEALSFYIIQQGQVRLSKPKGMGHVEIAVLRSGEILGEMAFFSEDQHQTRSCSAEAIIPSEVIEISFVALKKTIQGLTPWFKVVFSSMAERLRKTNLRVKSLETNNVSRGFGANATESYKFFMKNDIIRSLSVLYLTMKSQGQKQGDEISLDMKRLGFFASDIFNIAEVKFLEFCHLLQELNLCTIEKKGTGKPDVLAIKDIELLKKVMVFFNAQKMVATDKQIKVSSKCEIFLAKMLSKIKADNLRGDSVRVVIDDILKTFKDENSGIDLLDLRDARNCGLTGEIYIGENEHSLSVNLKKLQEVFLPIKVMNAVERYNKSKQKPKRYG